MANRRVALVGCGMVGMSYAYALLNSDLCNELILIDINEEKALGEAMDLNHGLCFSSSHMKIRAGSFEDCQYADLVVITASAGSRKPGQTRLDLLQKNVGVFKSFISKIVASGFNGIFLVASNPVDVMTRLTYELSGFPANRVIGSGTTLDTARLRYLIGDYFQADPHSVHGYVIGEHGDSEFVPFSQLNLSTKNVEEFFSDERFKDEYKREDIEQIIEKVKICIDAPRIVFTVVTNCDTFLILCHNSSIYFSCMAAAREVDNMALGECSFIQKFTVPVGGCT